jgi:hypothetical protein
MGSRLVELVTGLAALASAVILAALLAAPILAPATVAAPPSPSSTVRASETPAPLVPPIGLFLMREPFSFGPCLALDLVPQSYPVAEGAVGEATVLWWQRGLTGCDSRTGDVGDVPATVVTVPDEDDPDGPPVGYRLEFTVPFVGAAVGEEPAEPPRIPSTLTILARQSGATLVQAVEEAPGSGQGYALDRVGAVEPPLNPLPTPES